MQTSNTQSGVVHTANKETTSCVSGCFWEVKKNGKLYNSSAQKVIVVAYKTLIIYERFYYRALTGESLLFWIGGLLWEVCGLIMEVQQFIYCTISLIFFKLKLWAEHLCAKIEALEECLYWQLKAHFQTKVGGWQDSNPPMLSRCQFIGCENNCKAVQTNSI